MVQKKPAKKSAATARVRRTPIADVQVPRVPRSPVKAKVEIPAKNDVPVRVESHPRNIAQATAEARPRDVKEFRFPPGYGDNRIVLLVRDPWWVYSYWEIRHDKEDEIVRQIEAKGYRPLKSVLRVYDVTDVNFNGSNAHSSFDIDLKGLATSWYINLPSTDRCWVVDIGIVATNGEFYLLARSNMVKTPRFGMSDKFDEEWMMPEEEYWRLFGLSGGYGIGKGSLEVREMVKRRIEEQITSGIVSSMSSPVGGFRPKPRSFWLVVDCELIVYGATEPDAHVTVQGKPIKLRPDGTFSLRYALPDGKQAIPVEATSNDGVDKRKITPIVTRTTER